MRCCVCIAINILIDLPRHLTEFYNCFCPLHFHCQYTEKLVKEQRNATLQLHPLIKEPFLLEENAFCCLIEAFCSKKFESLLDLLLPAIFLPVFN